MNGARTAAARLDAAVEQAIAAGRVPAGLRRPLREAVDRILASVPAAPPTTTADEDSGHEDKGKKKGKKGDGKG